ncbi:DUF4344 domain-containing metallopeptidase [Roseibium sp. RKSG952]|uniref:DUF4344 domain-containing metallopeptidase n=1 Tax=Roseibium sp. RKSG952 TaxID=2529384 RepID=UPI0012BC46CA|nr:DUF4344 domain-containing metallopeptidase [Roseibium sp. RKSG952]MTI03071.1 hypothetical protein [Roseibium sp. RKSG952]
MLKGIAFCASMIAAPVAADTDDFVEANLLSIFYHELGHALIDILKLPVFGQEEDAADVASILLIDAFFEEEYAVSIAYDAAFGFLGEAHAAGSDIAWWDVHGPDLQRYYNLVCLFVGADMDARSDMIEDLELPEERQDSCEEEFDLANSSWGPVFDEIEGSGTSIRYTGGTSSLTEQIISEEVAALNQNFRLPQTLKVTVEDCGEANAYYDLERTEITICSEFEGWLREIAP